MSSLIETSIKNGERYHFDEITIIKDLDLDKILVYEKPIQNIFIYRVAYKISSCEKPLHIGSDEPDGYIKK